VQAIGGIHRDRAQVEAPELAIPPSIMLRADEVIE
jgi:hypothetical protein